MVARPNATLSGPHFARDASVRSRKWENLNPLCRPFLAARSTARLNPAWYRQPNQDKTLLLTAAGRMRWCALIPGDHGRNHARADDGSPARGPVSAAVRGDARNGSQ